LEGDALNDTQNPAEKAKAKFDWVSQRYSCSLPAVFKELRTQVEQDVKTRNGLRPNNAPYEFSLADHNGGFRVSLKGQELEMGVSFSLAEHAILVRDDKGVEMFAVTLTFNDQGECKLSVDSEDRDYWQVRRMALEGLMFHSH
jgi:hypothetical protein